MQAGGRRVMERGNWLQSRLRLTSQYHMLGLFLRGALLLLLLPVLVKLFGFTVGGNRPFNLV